MARTVLWAFLTLWSVAVGHPWECCESIFNNSEFPHCVLQRCQHPEIQGKVALAMFASNKTLTYSPFTILINSYYSHTRNYDFKLFTDLNSPFSYSPDKRWNKIGIVMDAFGENGWGVNIEYLAVVDADLIVTDFSLNVWNVASSHPEAHLLLSRDAADVANSGFLIVKNSQWSLRFFSSWWEKRLLSVTDQSAFNTLYHEYNAPAEIVLLPPNEINSEYPVYQTFNPQSPVLHLFGEIDEIRTETFRFAAVELCRHLTSHSQATSRKRRGPKRYPPQLGLTSTKLREFALDQILLRREEIKSQILTCAKNVCPEVNLIRLLENLQSETTSLCGYGRRILTDLGTERCLQLSMENYDLVKSIIPSNLVDVNTSIAYLDHLSQTLYAAFTWSTDSFESVKRGEEVSHLQNLMIQSGQLTSLSPVLYRQSVILSELARMCDRLVDVERNPSLRIRAIEFARLSLQWIQATQTRPGEQDYETHVRGIVDSYMLLAELLLRPLTTEMISSEEGEQSRILEGISLALTGLKWADQLVKECERIRSKEVASSRELLKQTCSGLRAHLDSLPSNVPVINDYTLALGHSCQSYTTDS